MDFGDVIVKTILLFKSRPNILKEYKSKFKYILVDEFQDTNFSQNELVKMLAGKRGNITVVADDDQSIYRFRGAAVSNVLASKL
jgi:DNA helicase-2/ATP-dependent DNA helicase PcrA